MSSKTQKTVSVALKHFCFSRHVLANIKRQAKLAKILSPLKKKGFISYRTYFIHIFSYISRSFNTHDKVFALATHYSYLQKKFDNNKLENLFAVGVKCFAEYTGSDKYSIDLCFSSWLEFEGSWLLCFNLNGVCLSSLTLTVVPGKMFNIQDEHIIYLSCVQRDGTQLANCSKAKKYFKNISLSTMLMAALEGVANGLQIKKAVGISARNQVSLNNEDEYNKFNPVYDQLWINNGAEPIAGDYLLTFPLPQKSVADVPKNQRDAVLAKQAKLDEICKASYAAIQGLLPHSFTTVKYSNENIAIGEPIS